MEESRHPGMFIQGLWFLSPKEAMETLQQGALLVDLRMDALVEMKVFSVPEFVHIPHRILAQHTPELPKDRPLILVDASGVYTRESAGILQALGFEQVMCLNGGMLDWEQAGMPISTDPAALLHGQCPCVLRPRKSGSK